MTQRYLPPTLLLLAGLILILLGGAREIFQTRTNQVADFVATTTPIPPTRTPLYAPTRTPLLATSLPVTPSPTVTPVPIVIPTDTPLPTQEVTAVPIETAAPTETTEIVIEATATDLPTVQIVTPSSTTVGVIETVITETPTDQIVISTVEVVETPTSLPPTETPRPTATQPPTDTPVPTNTPLPIDPNFGITYRERFGVSGAVQHAIPVRQAGLNYGSFITWDLFDTGELPVGVEGWQMVRVAQGGVIGGFEPLGEAVRANPGGVFVIGNEPDVEVQDNTTAPRYAEIYHDAYYYIKGIDPTAQVAIAGVGSPTPLRRFYLELMLDHYEQTYGEKMPIDIWTIHVYVLREERDSWGIGIPTGLDGTDEGMLYEIDDHKNAAIANQLLTDFRWWLAERGYRDTPLAITEFGILLPADYGFPPEVVANYMRTLVNYYLTATGGAGYPSDGNKLVQWWFWFSIRDTDQFEVSDMVDDGWQLNEVGRTYADYLP